MSINKIRPLLFITILIVIFSSIFINKSKISQKSEEVQTPINPTPNKIKVLGIEDTKKTTPTKINFDSSILYGLINSYREENKLAKLFVNKSLEESATRKVEDMIERKYFRHEDANNNESWYLFKAAGYEYKFAGENLSSGNNTPWQVFEAWQKSPAHNEQLLKAEYLDMGLAVECETYKIGKNPSCIIVLHLGAK